ncbi:hypothetical protein DYB37_013221 [Aphanomyces astaci]|uniref:Uncharacterized protein n=1 Tax=Aphanomyces astaci TaxID=112090 RepID=A0A3R7AMZ1_APHAT|nr:hypothetical protein DYB37_013221 [Aphanomyces astaci]
MCVCDILTDFVYDDKDLYRLAWLKAAVPFHMIERSPGDVHLVNYKPVSYVLGDSGCFGHSYDLVDMYTETNISQTSHRMTEAMLLVYAGEGMRIKHLQGIHALQSSS